LYLYILWYQLRDSHQFDDLPIPQAVDMLSPMPTFMLGKEGAGDISQSNTIAFAGSSPAAEGPSADNTREDSPVVVTADKNTRKPKVATLPNAMQEQAPKASTVRAAVETNTVRASQKIARYAWQRNVATLEQPVSETIQYIFMTLAHPLFFSHEYTPKNY
jgi:hypothetical protein